MTYDVIVISTATANAERLIVEKSLAAVTTRSSSSRVLSAPNRDPRENGQAVASVIDSSRTPRDGLGITSGEETLRQNEVVEP